MRGALRGVAGALAAHVVNGGDVEHIGSLLGLSLQAAAGGGHPRCEEVRVARVDAVEEDVVVLAGEAARGGAAKAIGPDEVVDKAVGAQDIVEQQADVVARPPVAVDEDVAGAFDGGECGEEAFAQPCRVVEHGGPCVGVGGVAGEGAAALFGGLCADGRALRLAGVEGRINVEQVDAA